MPTQIKAGYAHTHAYPHTLVAAIRRRVLKGRGRVVRGRRLGLGCADGHAVHSDRPVHKYVSAHVGTHAVQKQQFNNKIKLVIALYKQQGNKS